MSCAFLHCFPLVNLERTTHVRFKYLTVSKINQGYLIKILGSENMHHMFFIYFGRKKCGNSAGVYNSMKKSNRIHQMTASSLLSNVQSNDEHLEANLCTMLQFVSGSQQYWFVRKSELKCMIHE